MKTGVRCLIAPEVADSESMMLSAFRIAWKALTRENPIDGNTVMDITIEPNER